MLSSLEVRWFYGGSIPRDVLSWFDLEREKSAQQTPRTDYYLRLAHEDSLGIKLREGKLELKQRQRQNGVIHFHERVAGIVEHWCKWGFGLAELDPDLCDLSAATPAWIGVYKERILRKYQITEAGKAMVADPEAYLEQGCHLELTHIHIEEKQGWSLGLEAFGNPQSLEKVLLITARHVFLDEAVPTLQSEDSCGYPEWLRKIIIHGNA